MKYRLLGRTGVKVSELCLGTMTFGDNFLNVAVVDQAGANKMVARALDAGINFFDTADVYAYGQAETILGRALKKAGVTRDKVIIATKVRGAMTESAMARSTIPRRAAGSTNRLSHCRRVRTGPGISAARGARAGLRHVRT